MGTPITITLDNTTGRIERGVLDPATNDRISEICSYEHPNIEQIQKASRFAKRGRAAHWDGITRLYHRGHRRFPAGLTNRIVEALQTRGYEVSLDYDIDEFGSAATFRQPGEEWALRDYQKDAVLDAIQHMRCMIRVATGGGKTVIAGHIIHKVESYTIFLVHTKDLLYQAKDTFISMFGEERVGQIGDGVIDPREITVATIQTIARALKIKAEFTDEDDKWSDDETDWEGEAPQILHCLNKAGLLIMDECHRVASSTAQDVVQAIPNAVYRFGLSASPWRDDNADLALEGAFGHVAVNISASYLIEHGFLVPPVIRMVPVPPQSFPKEIKYPTIYKEYIEQNVERNALVTSHTYRMVQRDKITMVLVRNIKHGETIKQMLADIGMPGVPFISGRDDSDLRREVVRDMRSGALRCTIASTIADEGLDIKPLNGMVLAGSGKSSTRALQRIGRALRPSPGKTGAEIVDFEDNARILYDHSARRRKIYETEERFSILDL